ncbi:MAG: MlaD family protein [Candidatus Cloacimonetes bacterium]|nr:MlaD family protein [Candidatus Cloacimonadota bacterium]
MVHFYKNIRETEIKVGIFVILSLIFLFFSYSWLNDWFLKNKYEIVKVLFDNVNNIEKGNSVFYRGVRIGRVQTLEIAEDGIIIYLMISQDIKINSDAIFIIKENDMMGTRIIDIIPGQSKNYINQNHIYTGITLPGLSDLVSNLNEISTQIENIMQKLDSNDDIFDRLNNVLTLTEENFQLLFELLRDAQEKDILSAFIELKQLSHTLQVMINENSENIDNTFKQTQYTFSKIDSFLITTETAINSFKKQLENQDSNLNKLFNDDQLYKNLLKTTQEMEFLLNDIKNNPKKYFKFSIF